MASVTPLLSTPTLSVGEFHCPPGDASWHETNRIGDRAHVVFARCSVVIRQLGREPVLATPNHAMLYNADQRYRRELHHVRGDESVFVELPQETLERLAGDSRLRATHVPTGRRTYLLQHLLVRQLRGDVSDELEAEELASRLVLSALAPRCSAAAARERTGADHRRARGGGQVGDRLRPLRAAVARRARPDAPRLTLPPSARLPRRDRIHARRWSG